MNSRAALIGGLLLASASAWAATIALSTPPGGGLRSWAGDDGSVQVALQSCAAGELLVRGDGQWVCSGASAHGHPGLAAEGQVNAPGNPLAWTKLLGVPAALADGTDDVGLRSITATGGLQGGGAAGADVTIGLPPSQVAPVQHEHRAACPAGAYARELNAHQALCITFIDAPLSHAEATLRAWSEHDGATLCELDLLQVACDAGFQPVPGAWLGNRTRDDEALIVNATTCADLDGVAAAGEARPSYACLVVGRR